MSRSVLESLLTICIVYSEEKKEHFECIEQFSYAIQPELSADGYPKHSKCYWAGGSVYLRCAIISAMHNKNVLYCIISLSFLQPTLKLSVPESFTVFGLEIEIY